MMTKKKSRSLTQQILLAMGLGLLIGGVLNAVAFPQGLENFLIEGVFYVVGKVFLASLKLLVVPLVFVSLVCGTASLKDVTQLGRLGGKTLGLYLLTTAFAVTVALVIALFISPGMGFGLHSEIAFHGKAAPALRDTIVNIFPTNPVRAMAQGKMLQLIVFSILFGFAISLVGKKAERVLGLFESLNEVIMRLVMVLMKLAPWGVFALLARVFAQQGLGAILPLAKYFFTVVLVLLIHAFITYPVFLKIFGGLSPVQFFKKFWEVIVFAFSTSSSNATLPITLETVENRLGVDNSVASFTIPLGATVNMDGTSIMQGVATVFIAQAYGIEIGVSGFLMVILTATLASVGTAGVPGVGLVTLAMVLRQVGLPVEGIGLIIGVDRLLDMARTAVNVTGDAIVTCIVAKTEKKFSRQKFYSS